MSYDLVTYPVGEVDPEYTTLDVATTFEGALLNALTYAEENGYGMIPLYVHAVAALTGAAQGWSLYDGDDRVALLAIYEGESFAVSERVEVEVAE